MEKRGRIKTFSGGDVILQEIKYADSSTSTANSYSGYETLATNQHSPISAARFDIKQYSAQVVMSGLQMLQNSGEEAIIDLMDSRMEIAEDDLTNRISTDLYGDGTGNGGKNITGLQAAVSDTPATGTYGSIDPATWSFWQNYRYRPTADGGAAASPSNIQTYMNRAILPVVHMNKGPNLAVADTNYYTHFLASLQAIQRITTDPSEMSGLGFSAIKYFAAGRAIDVVLDGGLGGACPTNHMYFLNTDYLHWRPHANRNFAPIGGDRLPVNQDAIVKIIGWAGNLTCSGRRYQSVLTDD